MTVMPNGIAETVIPACASEASNGPVSNRRFADLPKSGTPECDCSLDEVLALMERSRTDGKASSPLRRKTAEAKIKRHAQDTTSSADDCPESQDQGDSSPNFFTSHLRQLRAMTFEEKLRQGRGEGVILPPESASPMSDYHKCDDQSSDADSATTFGDTVRSSRESSGLSTDWIAADEEKNLLREKLSQAEAEVIRLSQATQRLRLENDAKLAALQAQCNEQACRHQLERDRLKNEVSAAVAETTRLQKVLLDEQRRSAEFMKLYAGKAGERRPAMGLPNTPQAIAPIIAAMEAEKLQHCDPEERAKMKKKLQMKWHPDKCINSALAKCVMQELQQQPAW